jgi:hypothetical protein
MKYPNRNMVNVATQIRIKLLMNSAKSVIAVEVKVMMHRTLNLLEVLKYLLTNCLKIVLRKTSQWSFLNVGMSNLLG